MSFENIIDQMIDEILDIVEEKIKLIEQLPEIEKDLIQKEINVLLDCIENFIIRYKTTNFKFQRVN